MAIDFLDKKIEKQKGLLTGHDLGRLFQREVEKTIFLEIRKLAEKLKNIPE